MTAAVLAQLLKGILAVAIWKRWLRHRWKWLSACVAADLAAIYLHGEFLDYVAALPADSSQAVTAGGYVPLAFVLKNTVIVGSVLAYSLFEIRASRGRKTNRLGPATNSASRAAGELASGEAPPADSASDGFEFLRHRRKLESRAEKIIKRKPAR